MMAPLPEDRPTWEQVLENEWLRKMTADEVVDRMLDGVDMGESSEYIEM